MPPDPPSRHAHISISVCERAFAHYYHPATILFPPNSKYCMKPWEMTLEGDNILLFYHQCILYIASAEYDSHVT